MDSNKCIDLPTVNAVSRIRSDESGTVNVARKLVTIGMAATAFGAYHLMNRGNSDSTPAFSKRSIMEEVSIRSRYSDYLNQNAVPYDRSQLHLQDSAACKDFLARRTYYYMMAHAESPEVKLELYENDFALKTAIREVVHSHTQWVNTVWQESIALYTDEELWEMPSYKKLQLIEVAIKKHGGDLDQKIAAVLHTFDAFESCDTPLSCPPRSSEVVGSESIERYLDMQNNNLATD